LSNERGRQNVSVVIEINKHEAAAPADDEKEGRVIRPIADAKRLADSCDPKVRTTAALLTEEGSS
jgi:hypothetical protein